MASGSYFSKFYLAIAYLANLVDMIFPTNFPGEQLIEEFSDGIAITLFKHLLFLLFVWANKSRLLKVFKTHLFTMKSDYLRKFGIEGSSSN